MVTLGHASPVLMQVFGILDSPEYSGVHRPVIHQGPDPPSSLLTNHMQVGSSAHPTNTFSFLVITSLLALMFRVRVWKHQSGFPVGPVWQTATLVLVLVPVPVLAPVLPRLTGTV